jgi:hypothetical protein
VTGDVTIRRATTADGEALERHAALSCEPPLDGEVLLLEVGGEPWAAYSLDSGRTIADAFRRTLRLRSLLRDFAFA